MPRGDEGREGVVDTNAMIIIRRRLDVVVLGGNLSWYLVSETVDMKKAR